MSDVDLMDDIEIPANLAAELESCRRLVRNPRADKAAMFERGATVVFRAVTPDDGDLWQFAIKTLYEIGDDIGLDDSAAQKVLDAALGKSCDPPGADEMPAQLDDAKAAIVTPDDMAKYFGNLRAVILQSPDREMAWGECARLTAGKVAAKEIGRMSAADELDRLIRDLDLFPEDGDAGAMGARDNAIQSRIAAALANQPHMNGHDAEPVPTEADYGTITNAPATIDDITAIVPAVFITPAAWPNEAPPPIDWLVVNRIPRGDVTTLHGDGGAGKTDIGLRLSANLARSAPDWLGHDIAAGKVLFVSAEEPEFIIRRRLWMQAQHDGYSMDELADNLRLWFPRDMTQTIMATPDRHGIMMPTKALQEIAAGIRNLAPVLVIVDNVAATCGGNQIDRLVARSYVNLWRQIAHGPSKPAVLLIDHPSLSGMTNGTGRGGNMDWRNAVRAALWLRHPDDKTESERGIRILETAKSNYGSTGNPLRLAWADGGLQLEHAPTSLHRLAKDSQCDETFLRLLDERIGQGSHVGRKATGMYAPKVFAAAPDNLGFTKSAFTVAMERLFAAGALREVWDPKRRHDYIDRAIAPA